MVKPIFTFEIDGVLYLMANMQDIDPSARFKSIENAIFNITAWQLGLISDEELCAMAAADIDACEIYVFSKETYNILAA